MPSNPTLCPVPEPKKYHILRLCNAPLKDATCIQIRIINPLFLLLPSTRTRRRNL